MKRTLILLPLALLLHMAGAQTWHTADKAELSARLNASATRTRSMAAYELRAELLAYRNATDAEPSERASSVVWNTGNSTKAEHLGLVSYQDRKVCVTIDPEEQMIVLAEPGDFFGPMGASYRDTVFTTARSITRSADENGMRYRVRFASGTDLSLIEFAFDKDGWLRRVETHWGNAVPVLPDNPLTDLVTPKVVLVMDAPRPLASNRVRTSPAEAIAFVNGQPVPKKPYAGYTIIDNRLHP